MSQNLLSNRRFAPLFVAQLLGAFNDNAFRYGLVILITYQLSETSSLPLATLIAMATGLFMLPYFLFSSLAGQLADRFPKAQLVRHVKSAEILIMGFTAYGFLTYSHPLLFFCLFAMGLQSTLFSPLKYSLLPELLSDRALLKGNAVMEAGTFSATLGGTIIGGLLVSQPWGNEALGGVLLCLAIAGYVTSRHIPDTGRSTSKHSSIDWNPARSTWHILSQSMHTRTLRLSILGISWFWFLAATIIGQLTPLAKEYHGANEAVSTFLFVVCSLGLALGSLSCAKLLKGKICARHAPLGALGVSVFVADLAFTTYQSVPFPEPAGITAYLSSLDHARMTLDIFFMTFCAGLFFVPLNTLLQHHSKPETRAQTLAANNIVNALFIVLSSVFVMGIEALGISLTGIFLIIGALNLITALYSCWLLPYELMRMFVYRFFRIVYRLEIRGLGNFEKAEGNVLLVSNHVSFIDPLALVASIPTRLTFAVNDRTAKRWWARPAMLFANPYPMSPHNPMAIKGLGQKLKNGETCAIYPEGRLSRTGGLMKVYEGTALLAQQADATLIPVHISGTEHSRFNYLGKRFRKHLPPKLTLTIHPPVKPQQVKHRKQAAEQLQRLMTESHFAATDTQQTIWQALIKAACKHGMSSPILCDPESDPISYAGLIRQSCTLGAALQSQLKNQSRIGLLLPNSQTTIATFFALQHLGKTPVMLNYACGYANVHSACKTSAIQTLITSKKFIEQAKLENLKEALEQALPYLRIIDLEDIRDSLPLQQKIRGLIRAQFPLANLHSNHNPTHRDAAVILFTSGSSGEPKGVVLSHQNLLSNIAQMQASLDISPEDRALNAMPIFHAFGLTNGTLLPILSGVRLNLYPTPLHYKVIPEYAYDTEATILLGTDTFLRAYARHAHAYDFYSLRYVFAGAEKVKSDTHMLWMERFGVRILEGYGMTEASPVIAFNTPLCNRKGSVGVLMPGIETRLEPVEGITEGGKLWVRGSNIMMGYLLPDSPQTLQTPPEGWHDTGDIVSIDADGFVTLLGRAKRFAKVGGEMVPLGLIEEIAQALWSGSNHVCIAESHASKGESITLFTTCPHAQKEAFTLHLKTMKQSSLLIPKKIVITDAIPMTATGKPDYRSIEEKMKLTNEEKPSACAGAEP